MTEMEPAKMNDLAILTINDQKSPGEAGSNGVGKKTYRVKDYIPRKYAGNYFKYGLIACAVLAIILLIAIIVGVVHSNKKGSKEQAPESTNDGPLQTNGDSETLNLEFPNEVIHTIPGSSSGETTTTTAITVPTIASPPSQQNTTSGQETNETTTTQASTTESITPTVPQTNSTKTNENDLGNVTLILTGPRGFIEFNAKNRSKSQFYEFDGNEYSVIEYYGEYNYFWYNPVTATLFYHLSEDVMSDNKTRFSHSVSDSRVKVHDMTYDHIGENLYVIDKVTGSLIVIDVKTGQQTILMAELIDPHHIEIDPVSGYLFILQHRHSILKAEMDGTNMKTFVKGDYLVAMTVDRESKRIYWADVINGVESSDYNGDKRWRFPIDGENIHDLAVVNNHLFWMWQRERDSEAVHHLVTCQIKNNTCGNHSMHEIHRLGAFSSIRVSHAEPKRDLSAANGCKNNNGGCQHLCLLKPDGGSSCACKLGWQLDQDRKTCLEVNEFLLYTYGKFFRGRTLDTTTNIFVDVIWPTPHEVKDNEIRSFDYDKKRDTLYYSDGRNIYTMSLMIEKMNDQIQPILVRGTNGSTIKEVACDRFTGNLYYLQSEETKAHQVRVTNIKFHDMYNKTVLNYTSPTKKKQHSDYDYDYGNEYGAEEEIREEVSVASLIMDPIQGHLFYAIGRDRKRYARRLAMNGTMTLEVSMNLRDLDTSDKLFTIDLFDKRIFGSRGSYYTSYTYQDYNGTNVKSMSVSDVRYVHGIEINRAWMYLMTAYDVWRVDKISGKGKVKMVPVTSSERREPVSAMKIISDAVPKTESSFVHPCNNKENGGCEQFCFLGSNSKAECACRDGETVGSDGRCHGEVEVNTTTSIPSRRIG